MVAILAVLAGSALAIVAGAIVVLVWACWSRTPWRELGFVRPPSWIRSVVLGVVFKLLMKSIVMPLFGAPAINPAYHSLAGNTAALPGMLAAVIIGAGFAEEAVFRGYMFERLGKLFGLGLAAKVAIVLASSALFALAHYPDQGVPGAEQAAITVLVFGAVFARTHRIWMPMIMHAAFDVTAVAIIYWGLEPDVAHLVFC